MITIIDNYDSFTYNLVHYFGDLGVDARVYRNDEKTAAEVMANTEAIVMSPGPCTPNEAGICLALVSKKCGPHSTDGRLPWAPNHRAGFRRTRDSRAHCLMHGKLSKIHHGGTSLFKGLPDGFAATRYHSLIVSRRLSGLPHRHGAHLGRPDHGAGA